MKSTIKPNFLIVGAAKAGTTSLAKYLNEHPDVFIPEKKELRYFVADVIKRVNPKDPLLAGILKQSVLEKTDYYNCFSKKHNLNGEASVHYLYHYEEAIPKIKNELGDIPIIIMLRNPVDRAISNWSFNIKDISSFDNAINRENEWKKKNYNSFWYYKSLGFYSEQVEAYLKHFSNVKVILFEDFIVDTKSTVQSIFELLNVESVININFDEIYNQISHIYSRNKFLNSVLSLTKGYNVIKTINDEYSIFQKYIINKRQDAKLIDREKYIKIYENDIKNTDKLLKDVDLNIWLIN